MASSFLLNLKHLKARIFRSLKYRSTSNDRVQPRDLELFLAEAFDLTHTGDESYYADGINGEIQASIKTRAFDPLIKKRVDSRDFHTHPNEFLGPKYIIKYDYYINGVPIVQRRQALPFDDLAAEPKQIGEASLEGFKSNVQESYNRYNTSTSYEIVAAHGYSIDKRWYNVSVFWQEYEYLNPETIDWIREGNRVVGYTYEDNKKIRVAERVNGNASREATCFIENKNLLLYTNRIDFKVPVKQIDTFSVIEEYTEMEALEKEYESSV